MGSVRLAICLPGPWDLPLGALGSGRGPVEAPETYTCGYAHSSHEPMLWRRVASGKRSPLYDASSLSSLRQKRLNDWER